MRRSRIAATLLLLAAVTLSGCFQPTGGPSPVSISIITGVIPPTLGDTPATAIEATDEYTGTVSWAGDWSWSSRFGGEKAYTATITLTAEPGYSLSDVPQDFFSVPGATVTSNGLGSGEITAVFPATASVTIGDSALGGVIAYILESGDPGFVPGEQRGLVAAASDQSAGVQWGGRGADQFGNGYTTGTAIGDGASNTTTLIGFFDALSQLSSPSVTYYSFNWAGLTGGSESFTDGSITFPMWNENDGTVAAKVAADYEVVDGAAIYSDWHLPSEEELDALYANRVLIGGFAAERYWTSTETVAGAANARYVDFADGSTNSWFKDSSNRIRAVRAF